MRNSLADIVGVARILPCRFGRSRSSGAYCLFRHLSHEHSMRFARCDETGRPQSRLGEQGGQIDRIESAGTQPSSASISSRHARTFGVTRVFVRTTTVPSAARTDCARMRPVRRSGIFTIFAGE